MNSTTIQKNRKMIRTQSWKPFLKRTWKLDFSIWRNKKSIETRPRGNLLIIRPRKWPSCKRKIHKIQLKNKIRKLHHSRIKTDVSRSFNRKACDIEVTLDAPRQLPPRRKASQLIPERTFKRVKVRTVDPAKAQGELSATLLKEHATTNSPTYTSIFSTILLSHIIKIPPEAPREAK